MKRLLPIFLLLVSNLVVSQSTDIPLGSYAYDVLDRITIKSGDPFFTSVRPYSRRKVIRFLDNKDSLATTDSQKFNLTYLRKEGREYYSDSTIGRSKKPILKKLFRYEPDLFAVRTKDFDLHLNPVMQLSLGNDNGLDNQLFINTRGIELRGTVDNKISFYTLLTENQFRLPQYVQNVQDTVGVIPLEGFWKSSAGDGYDALRALGYIDFNISKHVSAQLGYGRNFIGNGERSLVLSDFSNSYPYLKITTEVWKIRYTNIFAELIADVFFFDGGTLGSVQYPRKYMALHHLDMNITPTLNIGLFESVIMGAPDSLGGADLKVQFLNPIIFYRAIEQQDGSPDNVIAGMDMKWDAFRKARIYGQAFLDEIVVSELLAGDQWWGNKFGYQIGVKAVDVLPNLDLQLEHNRVRPFTYTHDQNEGFLSYSHYRQPLAHPLGANFNEILFKFRYQPIPRLTAKGTFLMADFGSGPVNGFSVGRDPLISSNEREMDFGNAQNQGIPGEILLGQLQVSYQFKHNLFADAQFTGRRERRGEDPIETTSSIFALGVRWNMPFRNYFF